MRKIFRRWKTGLAAAAGLVLAGCAAMYLATSVWPSLGAQGADALRSVLGDQAVASLEGTVFQAQDILRQWEYHLGIEPDAPWSPALQADSVRSFALTPTATPFAPQSFPLSTEKSTSKNPETPQASPTSAATPTPVPWTPADLAPFGSIAGEGEWTPYLADSQGRVLGYRTFLQPDPDRQYALVALVALDLSRVRLEYVPGTAEPASDVKIARTGKIPDADRREGILLAVFNGGWQTRHGAFGVMIDGQILVPMRSRMGTLAIYPDGRIRIGRWGDDFTSCEGFSVLRQNGPMIVDHGQINPLTDEDSNATWGATVSGGAATWRSAIGIDLENRVLYYAVGWSMSVGPLARALRAARVHFAFQLDIHYYWVLFGTVAFTKGEPAVTPLLEQMKDDVNRYLGASRRDYFYLASASRSAD